MEKPRREGTSLGFAKNSQNFLLHKKEKQNYI
jgi:hypothetical protein